MIIMKELREFRDSAHAHTNCWYNGEYWAEEGTASPISTPDLSYKLKAANKKAYTPHAQLSYNSSNITSTFWRLFWANQRPIMAFEIVCWVKILVSHDTHTLTENVKINNNNKNSPPQLTHDTGLFSAIVSKILSAITGLFEKITRNPQSTNRKKNCDLAIVTAWMGDSSSCSSTIYFYIT